MSFYSKNSQSDAGSSVYFDEDSENEQSDYGESPVSSRGSPIKAFSPKFSPKKSKKVKDRVGSDEGSDSDDIEVIPFETGTGVLLKHIGLNRQVIRPERNISLIDIHDRRADIKTMNIVSLNLTDRRVVKKYITEMVLGNKKYSEDSKLLKALSSILHSDKIEKGLSKETLDKLDEILDIYSTVSKQISKDRKAFNLFKLAKSKKLKL
jgi:hypothetical protein